MKRIGIVDVARAAGVSPGTVSHAFNGHRRISDATRDRVLRIAAELGYTPNRLAAGLRNPRSGTIGFLSDEVATTPFAGQLVLGAQDAVADKGWLMILVNVGRDRSASSSRISDLLAQQVDGIVYATMYNRTTALPAVLHKFPTVLVNNNDPTSDKDTVIPDEFKIGWDATHHLLEHGHTRIGHLTPAPGNAADGRAAGYRAAMRDAGLTPLIARGEVPGTTQSGRIAAAHLLDQHPDVTAVFCFNDQMAFGAYQIAAQRGLRVPEDLSVVGVDNLELIAQWVLPGLTTVALPHYEMGRIGVDMLAESIEADTPSSGRLHQHHCKLISRGSVTQPRTLH